MPKGVTEDVDHITDLDEVDWDSDDSGVTAADMHYEDDTTYLEYDIEDVDLDLHVETDGAILLVATDNGSDQWRSVAITLTADGAETLGKQLTLASQLSNEGGRGDIRL